MLADKKQNVQNMLKDGVSHTQFLPDLLYKKIQHPDWVVIINKMLCFFTFKEITLSLKKLGLNNWIFGIWY